MRRAVIFDFGGVITRTTDYRPRHAWDDRLGKPRGTVERIVHGSESWIKAQVGRISLADYWDDVARQLDLTPEQVQQLAQDFYAGDALNTDLVDYIRELREQGHTVALLSNFGLMLKTMLDDLGIAALFDPCVISARIGVMKPDVAAYQAVLKRLDRPPEETIFLDDSPVNVQAANELGIHAIHFTPDLDVRAAMRPLLRDDDS